MRPGFALLLLLTAGCSASKSDTEPAASTSASAPSAAAKSASAGSVPAGTAAGQVTAADIVGTWKMDAAAMAADMAKDPRIQKMAPEGRKQAIAQSMQMMSAMTVTITADGHIMMRVSTGMNQDSTYRVLGVDGQVVTLEVMTNEKAERVNVTVDGDKIRLQGPKGPALSLTR